MTVVNPVTGKVMPLVADTNLMLKHGTGFHTVTPAHNLEDLRLADLHSNIDKTSFLSPTNGSIINSNCSELDGMNRDDPRLTAFFKSHTSFFGSEV